jgi:hypothetical protein
MFYYSFQWKYSNYFGMPSMWRYKHVAAVKDIQKLWRTADKSIDDACWHCSYCFGPTLEDATNGIIQKIKSFAHTEYDKPPFTTPEYIADSIMRGLSPFRSAGNPMKFKASNATIEAPPALLAMQPELSYMLGVYSDEE